MATSIIKTNYKRGTVTPNGNVDTTNVIVIQEGRTITVNGYVRNVNITSNAYTKLFEISNVNLPREAIRLLCEVADEPHLHPQDVCYGVLNDVGGFWIVSNISATKSVWFSFSYNI